MEELVERALSMDMDLNLDLVGKSGGGAYVLGKEGGSTGEGVARF
jgi:hypothetical protein